MTLASPSIEVCFAADGPQAVSRRADRSKPLYDFHGLGRPPDRRARDYVSKVIILRHGYYETRTRGFVETGI